MARFNIGEEERYGGQGGGGYFSLKNDKDTAKVRFLYDSIEDVQGYAVHEIQLNDKKRYVNCIREYGDPVDSCPLCKAQIRQTPKFFIPLWNVDEERTQIWERGKQFGAKLSSLCGRYPSLVGHVFEIERNGKPGSTSTTYEIYPIGDSDNSRVEDFDEATVLGGVVLDKSFEDMEYFLNKGTFPSDNNTEQGRRRSEDDDRDERPVGRRTPSRRGDSF